MSWRTQSRYKGLGEAEREWLKGFDRQWDTKAYGRSRQDAFEHMSADDGSFSTIYPKSHFQVPKLSSLAATSPDEECLEVKLASVSGQVVRFTVPKELQSGWSIHLLLKCGKRVRARFQDYASALQAYGTLKELSSTLLMS